MTAKDISTANKIREAAQRLFSERGYGRVTTRDIASAAGVNLALVNYYFKSKEQLFKSIMLDVIKDFADQLRVLLNDDHTFDEKVELLVSNYIDLIIAQPELPIFMLSEIRNHPEEIAQQMGMAALFREATFFKELSQRIPDDTAPIHYFMNILSMTVFPHIGKPMLQTVSGLSDDAFTGLMLQRKRLIPKWILATLKPNDH